MHYAAVILDLDGVVYIGADAVPYAVEALNAIQAQGSILAAATNNANRPAQVVAHHLHSLGLVIEAGHVMTSAQAAAKYLSTILPAGANVLAVGGDGVAEALLSEGLSPLRASQDLAMSNDVANGAAAVLVGYGPLVAWFDLATAHWAIERGKPWFATNTDPTVPLAFGRAPGNGAMVGLLIHSTGVEPVVIGKPKPTLFNALAAQLETRDILVIGDRLDTDIDGAIAAGLDSLLVLTGVHGIADLALRPTDAWPMLIAQDLRGLHAPIARIWRDGGNVLADSEHPLVGALVQAARGTHTKIDIAMLEAAPLVDVSALRGLA